jgi:hypothetical protein
MDHTQPAIAVACDRHPCVARAANDNHGGKLARQSYSGGDGNLKPTAVFRINDMIKLCLTSLASAA